MDLIPSPRFEKSMRRLDRKTRELVYRKLESFLQNKMIRLYVTRPSSH